MQQKQFNGRGSIVGPERVIRGGSFAAVDDIPIDDGIPMPARRRGVDPKYPFGKLAVGQSFFVAAAARNVRSAARLYGIAHNKSFQSRLVNEGGKAGVRIWRTK